VTASDEPQAVESHVYQSRCGCGLFCCRRLNLEQSLPAEVRGKHEEILVLHHNFQNVPIRRFVSIVEADAGAVKRVRGHPVFARQKPMASGEGRPDLQISSSVNKAVFNVNQTNVSAARQIGPRDYNC
jgi:hypothetical protein